MILNKIQNVSIHMVLLFFQVLVNLYLSILYSIYFCCVVVDCFIYLYFDFFFTTNLPYVRCLSPMMTKHYYFYYFLHIIQSGICYWVDIKSHRQQSLLLECISIVRSYSTLCTMCARLKTSLGFNL